MIVTIHQPNFMPWYPFFQKMKKADVFVILTQCQFEKNGFQNRFNHQGQWKTLSINKGLQPIVEKKYVNSARDWAKIKNTRVFIILILVLLMGDNLLIVHTVFPNKII